MHPGLSQGSGGGTSLLVQWLRFCVPSAQDTALILRPGTKIPHSTWCGQKKRGGLGSRHLAGCAEKCGLSASSVFAVTTICGNVAMKGIGLP